MFKEVSDTLKCVGHRCYFCLKQKWLQFTPIRFQESRSNSRVTIDGTNDGMLVVKVTDSNGTTRRLLLDQPYTYVTL